MSFLHVFTPAAGIAHQVAKNMGQPYVLTEKDVAGFDVVATSLLVALMYVKRCGLTRGEETSPLFDQPLERWGLTHNKRTSVLMLRCPLINETDGWMTVAIQECHHHPTEEWSVRVENQVHNNRLGLLVHVNHARYRASFLCKSHVSVEDFEEDDLNKLFFRLFDIGLAQDVKNAVESRSEDWSSACDKALAAWKETQK